MNRESVVFAISGTMFGLLVGWILGTQQAATPAVAAAPAGQQSAQLPATPAPPPLDVQRAAALERQANDEPANASVRVELGNLYFDAERFDLAISWYEAAMKLDPKNVNASTDLAVSYYSANQIDRALAQFDVSLKIDASHTKTLLNQGIVRAFGKQDLEGASQSWDRLVAIAPNSPEAIRAKEALAAIKTAHPTTPGAPAAPAGRGGTSS
jgi:tetratricopeptide (TPR) repeat protein